MPPLPNTPNPVDRTAEPMPDQGLRNSGIDNPQQPATDANVDQSKMDAIYKALKANQYGPTYKSFAPGFLFGCEYLFYKHDPRPLVLMTRIYQDNKVAGVNLHYLTFPYMRHLIKNYCGKGNFSYQTIKSDRFIVNAYRCYKRQGLRKVKSIDCNFLIAMLGQLRSFNPEEVEAMRKQVQKQLQEKLNPKASDFAKNYSQIIPPGKEDFGVPRPTKGGPNETPNLGTIPTQKPIGGQSATVPTG